MKDLRDFARLYVERLASLASASSDTLRAKLSAALTSPSIVVLTRDVRRCVALEIVSTAGPPPVLNGFELRGKSSGEFGMASSELTGGVEQLLFPFVNRSSMPAFCIKRPRVTINGIIFKTSEFMERYGTDPSCAYVRSEFPFSVEEQGELLITNGAYQYTSQGAPACRYFEFLKLFGPDCIIPSLRHEVAGLAISDFGSFQLGKSLEPAQFDEFLKSLRKPVERNVLILGSFAKKSQFDAVKTALRVLGFSGFTLLDAGDLPIQKNVEKLYAGIMFSAFAIVIDESPSGHIAELQILLERQFRPVIVVRTSGTPSTRFLEDSIQTNDFFNVASIESVSAEALAPYVRWAKQVYSTRISKLDAVNDWREPPSGPA